MIQFNFLTLRFSGMRETKGREGKLLTNQEITKTLEISMISRSLSQVAGSSDSVEAL